MDKFIAPDMSKFTEASIPDMSDTSREQDYWLRNFMLNTLVRVTIDEPTRQTLFNFLRRAELAFREYGLAREQTLAYLQNTEAITPYFAAISHWEVYLSHAYQAYCLLARGQKILFKKGDGSILERLNLLYNRSKHVDKAIEAGQLPSKSTMAIWLTNDGIQSINGGLTFTEMADILTELAMWSDAAQDPLTMREKVMEHYQDMSSDGTEAGSSPQKVDGMSTEPQPPQQPPREPREPQEPQEPPPGTPMPGWQQQQRPPPQPPANRKRSGCATALVIFAGILVFAAIISALTGDDNAQQSTATTRSPPLGHIWGMDHRTTRGTSGLSRTPRSRYLPGEMFGASHSFWTGFFLTQKWSWS